MIRFCKDIGMYVLDRPRETSCVHKTKYCAATCYNSKLEKAFPNIHPRDIKNEEFWKNTDAGDMAKLLSRRTKGNKRIRLCSRGEAFADNFDVWKVFSWVLINNDWTWWIPTRAWRNNNLRTFIEQNLLYLPNVRIMASIDPTNTQEEIESLLADGWSLLYYGTDEGPANINGWAKCPKTFEGIKGHCAVCNTGCFDYHDVILKRH